MIMFGYSIRKTFIGLEKKKMHRMFPLSGCLPRNTRHKLDYIGPGFMVKVASFDMHPMDDVNRSNFLKNVAGLGYCNVNKCCQEICPEHIIITDDSIIPEKERVIDRYYDPFVWLYRKLRARHD